MFCAEWSRDKKIFFSFVSSRERVKSDGNTQTSEGDIVEGRPKFGDWKQLSATFLVLFPI